MISFGSDKEWLDVTKDLADGVIFIRTGSVNLDDLLNCRPGMVVCCEGNPSDAVMFIPPQLLDCDFVAGMISDAA